MASYHIYNKIQNGNPGHLVDPLPPSPTSHFPSFPSSHACPSGTSGSRIFLCLDTFVPALSSVYNIQYGVYYALVMGVVLIQLCLRM
jgi:hypothetical protein